MLVSHPISAFSALLIFSAWSNLLAAASSLGGCPGYLHPLQCHAAQPGLLNFLACKCHSCHRIFLRKQNLVVASGSDVSVAAVQAFSDPVGQLYHDSQVVGGNWSNAGLWGPAEEMKTCKTGTDIQALQSLAISSYHATQFLLLSGKLPL